MSYRKPRHLKAIENPMFVEQLVPKTDITSFTVRFLPLNSLVLSPPLLSPWEHLKNATDLSQLSIAMQLVALRFNGRAFSRVHELWKSWSKKLVKSELESFLVGGFNQLTSPVRRNLEKWVASLNMDNYSWLVGGWTNPPKLKNMRKSNWISSLRIGEKTKVIETKTLDSCDPTKILEKWQDDYSLFSMANLNQG